MNHARIGILALLVAGPSCHRVFPYQSADTGQPDRDGRLDVATDRHVLEGPAATDGARRPDSKIVPADMLRSCSSTTNCYECDPTQYPQCGACTPGPDCDDLPAERDPWPHCNARLLDEPFCGLSRWDVWSNGGSVQPQGLFRFACPSFTTCWAWLTDTTTVATLPGAPTYYLAEARLIVPPLKPKHAWKFQLRPNSVGSAINAEAGRGKERMCQVEYFPPESAASTGTLELSGNMGAEWATTPLPAPTLSFSSGALILQSWVDAGQHHCRLFLADQPLTQIEVWGLTGATSSTNKSLVLYLVNEQYSPPLDLYVDWVRAFQP